MIIKQKKITLLHVLIIPYEPKSKTQYRKGFKLYVYNKNILYNVYEGVDIVEKIIIYHKDDKDFLIGGNRKDIIGIWNFHNKKLLKKFDVYTDYYIDSLVSICLWNNEYLFVGCLDKKENENKKYLIFFYFKCCQFIYLESVPITIMIREKVSKIN